MLLLKTLPFVLFKLAIRSWHIIGDGLAIELLTTEKGNRTTIIANHHELQNVSASDQSSVSNPLNHCLKLDLGGGKINTNLRNCLQLCFTGGKEDMNS